MNKIKELVQYIGSLPNINEKTAERIVLSLIDRKDKSKLLELLNTVFNRAIKCKKCGNLDTNDPCSICINQRRNSELICIVADIVTLWAIENADFYNGKYYVIDQTPNSLTGILPENIKIESLINRIKCDNVKEVIIALNPDINGQTAMFYISDHLSNLNVKITTLSCGVPIGAELDRLSYGTIIAAFNQRRKI